MRLNLARAAYQCPDVLLIDDALAALDPRVGQRVFGNLAKRKGATIKE